MRSRDNVHRAFEAHQRLAPRLDETVAREGR